MLTIYFYKFLKKNNSTALPSVSTPVKEVSCLLRQDTSVINPVLIIDNAKVETDSLFDYNYVFIQTFHRYYFIRNYVYSNNTWSFYLTCDILGSFYLPYLSSTTQHIIRTSDSTKGDPDMIDNFYKSKIRGLNSSLINSSDKVYTKSNYSNYYYTTSWADYFSYSASGCYIVGVVNQNGNGLTYYRMSETVFTDFINKTLQVSITMSVGSTNLNTNLAKTLFDPIQFIKYCRWFPIDAYIPGQGVTSLYVGSAEINLTSGNTAFVVTPEKGIMVNGTLIQIPKNPASGTLRKYLSLSPFAEYNLFFPVLGMVPLDSARMYKFANLELKWITDYSTGNTDFYIIPTNRTSLTADNDPTIYLPSDNSSAMYYTSISLGVDVPLYNLSMDLKSGLAVSGVAWLKSKIEENNANVETNSYIDTSSPLFLGSANPFYKTDFIEKATAILSEEFDGVVDALATSLGQLKAQGSPNSFMTYCDQSYPFIVAMFYTQENMQLSKYGMPSDFNAVLSTLGNCFIMCKSPQFNVSSASSSPCPVITKEEQNACISFLRNGIYIE